MTMAKKAGLSYIDRAGDGVFVVGPVGSLDTRCEGQPQDEEQLL